MPTAFADIAVVEIKVANHHIIGESREINTRFLPAAKNRRRLAAADEPGQITRYIAGLAGITAERAAQRVRNEAFGLMDNLRGEVFIFQSRSVSAYIFGDRLHGIVPCLSLLSYQLNFGARRYGNKKETYRDIHVSGDDCGRAGGCECVCQRAGLSHQADTAGGALPGGRRRRSARATAGAESHRNSRAA